MNWLFGFLLTFLRGGGELLLGWQRQNKAQADALRADRAEGQMAAKAKSEDARREINNAQREALNDPAPNMRDWS